MDRVQAHRIDIQKLAEKDKIKGGLKSIQEREPIAGGFTPFESGAFAPDSNAGAGKDGGIDPTDPNSFAEPDPTDPTNPNNKGVTNNRDPNKDGPQKADDLLTDKKGPVLPDGSSSDPYSGGSLNKINGLHDCDTGQNVTVHADGNLPIPAGWDNATSGAPVRDWVLGFNWEGTSYGISTFFTGSEEAINNQPHAVAVDSPGVTNEAGNYIIDSWVTSSDANGPASYAFHMYVDRLPQYGGPFIGIWLVARAGCAIGSSSSCPATEPRNYTMPSDGSYDVGMISGKLQVNQHDPDLPASAKETRSAAIFCTTAGKRAMVRAAANGGTMIYEVSQNDAPTGTVKVYNSDGTLRFAGDATNTNIQGELPR